MANREVEAGKNSEMREPTLARGGRNPLEAREGASNTGSREERSYCEQKDLLEQVVEQANMLQALERVEFNRGGGGVDGMSTVELRPWLKMHWRMIKTKLLDGTYEPEAVKEVMIPKPDGGERQLGIPTVLDRLIQQAIAQVLMPMFDPDFSEQSYGFRPNKRAIQAVKQAREYQVEGKRWVVDLDLEKFFDEVNHDILMQSLRKKIKDQRLLKLIGKYLRSGLMREGVESQRTKGTPQGGPLSPLLSNILLDRFDKELEKRGHSYVRYADDCNIYVQSKRSGERVLKSVTSWLGKHLKLKVNQAKSSVGRPWQRKFLGYSVTSNKKPKLRIAPKSVKRFKSKIKTLMRRGRGRNQQAFIADTLNPVLRGWIGYYYQCETYGVLDQLDGWIRRRLRNIQWRQWKKPRTRRKKLLALGASEETASASAYNGRGAWWNSGATHLNLLLPKKYFDKKGLISLQERRLELDKIALL